MKTGVKIFKNTLYKLAGVFNFTVTKSASES